MDRIQLILKHKDFIKYCKKNKITEKKRKFCKHDIVHFADVARIAYIHNLENKLGFHKEIIYAAALLHDIGKWMQQKNGIPHNEASVLLSTSILQQCNFEQNEIDLINSAILTHRNYKGDKNSLNYTLFFADKKSRRCFYCKSEKDCSWADNMKNMSLLY